MPQLNLFPVGQIVFSGPGNESAEQSGIGLGRVIRLAALVAQVLQEIFNERLHVRRITQAARQVDDEMRRQTIRGCRSESRPCVEQLQTSVRSDQQ